MRSHNLSRPNIPITSRVGHGSGPSTGLVGSGRVHLRGSVWVTLDYTKCYAKCNCKVYAVTDSSSATGSDFIESAAQPSPLKRFKQQAVAPACCFHTIKYHCSSSSSSYSLISSHTMVSCSSICNVEWYISDLLAGGAK